MLRQTESGRAFGRDPMTEIAPLAELARYMKPVILAAGRASIRARRGKAAGQMMAPGHHIQWPAYGAEQSAR